MWRMYVCSLKVYKEQLKRESVLTAKAIINNDCVKSRYEKYIKVTVTNTHEFIIIHHVIQKGSDGVMCCADL